MFTVLPATQGWHDSLGRHVITFLIVTCGILYNSMILKLPVLLYPLAQALALALVSLFVMLFACCTLESTAAEQLLLQLGLP